MSRMSLSDAKPISVQDVTAFWTQMGEASSHQNIGFFRTTYLGSGPIYVISLHHSVRMIPFVRSQEELFEATAKRASKLHKLRIVINGPAYGLTTLAKSTHLPDPIPYIPARLFRKAALSIKAK